MIPFPKVLRKMSILRATCMNITRALTRRSRALSNSICTRHKQDSSLPNLRHIYHEQQTTFVTKNKFVSTSFIKKGISLISTCIASFAPTKSTLAKENRKTKR
jgi:hypothetical protein